MTIKPASSKVKRHLRIGLMASFLNPPGPAPWGPVFQMPIVYISFAALALYGLYQTPPWLREVILAFAGLVVVCVVLGFIWQVLRQFVGAGNTSTDPTLMQKYHSSGNQQVHSDPPETPPPAKRDKASIQRDDHGLKLFEDDFLR